MTESAERGDLEPQEWAALEGVRPGRLLLGGVMCVAAATAIAGGSIACAEPVTGTLCEGGGGMIQLAIELPHECLGGRWDGAHVWSLPRPGLGS